MCSIILRIDDTGVLIGANRDEILSRAWLPPAAHWPEYPDIIAGKDLTAGGTWMALNRHSVMAAVLNREGTLGPAPGKRSRGELPLFALSETTAAAAAAKIAVLDASLYRSFNLVIAGANEIFFLRGLEHGAPQTRQLKAGCWMITSGEPNDLSLPRIARHLPKFAKSDEKNWPKLLADNTPPLASTLNIPPDAKGFGTVCSSVLRLAKTEKTTWLFCAAPLDEKNFQPVIIT